MKNLLMTAVLFVAFSSAFAQQKITKNKELYRHSRNGSITQITTTEGGEVTNIYYYWSVRNDKYSSIYDGTEMYFGSDIDELNEMIDDLIATFEHEEGTSYNIENGNSIYMSSYAGVMVYGEGDDDNNYHYFTKKQLLKLKKAMSSYV